MRIAIDGIPLSQPKAGVGHYTFEIACGVAALAPSEEFQVVSQIPFVIDGSSCDLQNLSFVQQPVNPITKHWWTVGLPLFLRTNSIDLFHGTNYDVPVWGGCPTVITIHDLSLFLFPETHEQRRVRRARRRLPTMARLATRIIVPTESVKQEACEHLSIRSEKIAVIPSAPRKCFFPMPREEAKETLTRLGIEDSFLLYVGTIEPRKNLLTLVRALEEIHKHTELRPQLIIAGQTGWLSGDLFDYVKRSRLNDKVLLTGYLDDEDLRALYSSCSVMSYPSFYEGAGLPPLEAMACGAPVITTTARAIVETVGDGALLHEPTDYQSLSQQITELMIDSKARDELIRRGSRRAAEFTWARAAQLTYQTYLDAMSTWSKQSQSRTT